MLVPYLFLYLPMILSLPLEEKEATALSSEIWPERGETALGPEEGGIESYVSLESLGYSEISIPDDVKSTVALPSWLVSWEDAEFVSVGGQYGNPLGSQTDNIELKAAAFLASMTGGVWMPENHSLAKHLSVDLDAVLLSYLESGDQAVLRELHADLGIVNPSPSVD